MSAEATIWVISVALVCFLTVSFGGLVLQGVLHSREDFTYRTTPSGRASRVCDASGGRFTVAAAHRAMQLHVDCLVGECPRKRAAYAVLVEEGHVRPDAGRIRVRA